MKKDAKTIAWDVQCDEGWNDATLLEVLFDFIDSTGTAGQLRAYLDTRRAEEVTDS